MSLIEQRKRFMSQLQTLIDKRQKEIDEKVAAKRAQVEAEYVQPYRAELEKEKVTPEISKLFEFIDQIDEMLKYEASDVATEIETEDEQAEDEQAEDEQTEDEQAEDETCVEEVVNDTSTFQTDANTNTNTVDECAENASVANETVGTGLDAIAADIADTNKKLQSVVEGRPGMCGIVLPRR